MSDVISLDEYRARKQAKVSEPGPLKRYPVQLCFRALGSQAQTVMRRGGKRIAFEMELPVARMLLGDLAQAIEQAQEK